MLRDLEHVARAAGGEVQGGNASFGPVLSDTRAIVPGALFVALRGERFDGHDFVPDALARGAVAALVSRPVNVSIPQVIVPDTLAGLSAFASAWRRHCAARVVGVTGSNGKTTVKEMLGAILARTGACLVTQGNLNNHIGVPLTLCRLEERHRHAVIEMGASHLHEIEHLAAIAEPDVGLVINAGPAHLEGFGGIEGVAKGKGEMFAALDTADTAVINADDRFATYWHNLARAAGTVVTFGMRERADVSASQVATQLVAGGFVTHFDLATPQGRARIKLPLAGEHNVMNALAAAAAALAAGADFAAVQQGLQSMRPVSGRLETRRALHGAQLIDDSYNANPGSLRAGLRALSEVPGERWLILGEMAELGEETSRLHAEVGEFARECGFSRLFAIGGEARHSVEAFGPGASWFASADELVAAVKPGLKRGLTVLVKGSRVNKLERVTTALAEPGHGATAAGAH
jgi:UDP-N-acetylmuramoyl-tripeptide--D-alanyl-D-alanine ligase